ncbi:MAG: putative acyl-CoA synthetase, long-chain fatty acid:CoA ligase [Mycobacterium sp.]|jgi:acyl-CoA synthetase (AMP-forming)/AMP-acid ligase II|nr:putative acyl-CoA synthetase, long-chain fatty acid:CoA ligase [Mycobacterium sp.]
MTWLERVNAMHAGGARRPGPPAGTRRPARLTRARLAGFKVPAHWYLVDALPLNSAGKPIRRDLRLRHLDTHGG